MDMEEQAEANNDDSPPTNQQEEENTTRETFHRYLIELLQERPSDLSRHENEFEPEGSSNGEFAEAVDAMVTIELDSSDTIGGESLELDGGVYFCADASSEGSAATNETARGDVNVETNGDGSEQASISVTEEDLAVDTEEYYADVSEEPDVDAAEEPDVDAAEEPYVDAAEEANDPSDQHHPPNEIRLDVSARMDDEDHQLLPEHSSLVPLEEIIKIFQCPRCSNYVRPPIYQCRKGALKCRLCTSHARRRRDCGHDFREECPDIPNTALNRVACQLIFPCCFQRYGCGVSGKLKDLGEHEERRCDFRTIACLYKRLGLCSWWTGTKRELVPHVICHHAINLEMEHGQPMPLVGQQVELYPIVDTIDYRHNSPSRFYIWVFLQSHLDKEFVIHMWCERNGFSNVHYVIVQMLATKEEANRYESEVRLEGVNGRTLGYSGVCHAIYDDVERIYYNRECLVFDRTTAEAFCFPSYGHKKLKLVSRVCLRS